MQYKKFVGPRFSEGRLSPPSVAAISDSFGRKSLSFHSVSFGEDASTTVLRRMADLALEIQNNAPGNALLPAAANIPSSFSTALDTVSTRASGRHDSK